MMGAKEIWLGVSAAVCRTMMAPSGMVEKELDASGWADEINEDYNRRSRKVRR